MICPYCKIPIIESTSFCEWCGKHLVTPKNSKTDNKEDNSCDNITHSYSKLDQELISLLKNGEALQTIKVKRQHSNIGLKEAKLYIDDLCEKEGIKRDKSGCFIATSCYGDYNSYEVIKFRLFRDHVLQKSLFGKMFISTYYTFSPYLVRMMDKSDFLKYTVRQFILHPLLNIVEYFIK